MKIIFLEIIIYLSLILNPSLSEVTEIIEKLEFDKIRLDLPTYNATQISSQIGGAGNKVNKINLICTNNSKRQAGTGKVTKSVPFRCVIGT